VPPAPKPTKADRTKQKKERKSSLVEYRHNQVALAILRDADVCALCWILQTKRTPRTQVHHVYGRGKDAGDWREHYTSLLCVCNECHPLPIQTPGANADLAYVEEVLRLANETPINSSFKPD
jgi:hypothetical protein